MMRGIVALAAALRLHAVAEGVETWEEAFFLRAAGVDCGQGRFWSKAVSAPEISRVLAEGYRADANLREQFLCRIPNLLKKRAARRKVLGMDFSFRGQRDRQLFNYKKQPLPEKVACPLFGS